MGLQTSDVTRWVDGSMVTYTNWQPDEPLTTGCVIMRGKNQNWLKMSCYEARKYICIAAEIRTGTVNCLV